MLSHLLHGDRSTRTTQTMLATMLSSQAVLVPLTV